MFFGSDMLSSYRSSLTKLSLPACTYTFPSAAHRPESCLGPGADPEPERTLRLDHQALPSSILGFPKSEVWRILRLLANEPGMRLLNFTKHQMGKLEQRKGWYRQSHAAFNFLLDFVPNWKFAYGRRPGTGLIQYQVFLPAESAHDGFKEILRRQQQRARAQAPQAAQQQAEAKAKAVVLGSIVLIVAAAKF